MLAETPLTALKGAGGRAFFFVLPFYKAIKESGKEQNKSKVSECIPETVSAGSVTVFERFTISQPSVRPLDFRVGSGTDMVRPTH
jgi:hypothetical protein